MSYTVRFSPEAEDQLDAIEQYIADARSPATAATYCASLATFPQRGRRRDNLMPGLRITNYRSRVVIAFLVDSGAELISIIGVFYGGQDYEARLVQDTE